MSWWQEGSQVAAVSPVPLLHCFDCMKLFGIIVLFLLVTTHSGRHSSCDRITWTPFLWSLQVSFSQWIQVLIPLLLSLPTCAVPHSAHMCYSPFMISPVWLFSQTEVSFNDPVLKSCSPQYPRAFSGWSWVVVAHLFSKSQIHIWVSGPELKRMQEMQSDDSKNLHVW